MAKSDYIHPNDAEFSAQLITFRNVIPDYATLLNLDPAVVTAQAADAEYFAWCLQLQELLRKPLCETAAPRPPVARPSCRNSRPALPRSSPGSSPAFAP